MASADPRKISPKVIAATIAAVIVPGVLAALAYVQANSDQLFGGLHPVVVVALSAIIPGIVTFVSGFVTTDPARTGTVPPIG